MEDSTTTTTDPTRPDPQPPHQLSGTTSKMPSSSTASGGGDGKQHQHQGPHVLLGSGAFHLEANRTRLLSDAMREHFGDTDQVPALLFIPYAAADGDYDAYVKRTIELVRLFGGGPSGFV